MFDWSQISPAQFEELCAQLLELNGFANIQWYGEGGGDKGRDLLATKTEEPLVGVRSERRWLVQCKRYSKKRVTKSELESLLAAAREHKPDVLLLAMTSSLSSDVRDWLHTVRGEYRFSTLVWERRELEQAVRRFREKLTILPPLLPDSKEPTFFYAMSPHHRIFMCNEVEEVGFYVSGGDALEDDLRKIREFIDYIRSNEIRFNEDDDDSADTD
jgi:hypothetical protein